MLRFANSLSRGLPQRTSAAAQQVARRNCGFLAAVDNVWTLDNNQGGGDLSQAAVLTDSAALDRATSTLHHRGPDGRHLASGTLSSPNASSGGKWAMGHQRLAIVDPNSRAADMPFVLQFDDQKIKLAANGEIYNHELLYDELVAKHGWKHDRISHSDCEVIAHACACLGPEEAVKHLDGMFAFTLFKEASEDGKEPAVAFAARDPVGIKPLYYGTSVDGKAYLFASELKALVGHIQPSSVKAIPPGHYWTPQTGLVRYHHPDWLFKEDYAPWEEQEQPSDDELRDAFRAAVKKRMMADVDYGFFLSGGVDSCILSHALLPMYRDETGDDRPMVAFTVGMEDSPDMMAAKAMVEALGGSRYIDHRPRPFTGDHVFDIIPKIIYHMETYEAELIRSAIPNWLLAERAGADVKMVLTGEGADELFAGYLYFMDAKKPIQVHNELKRIYNMLGDINLHRTDRMTMAHGLEARVPFLDTKFTAKAMHLDPALKMVDPKAVANNAPGREKTFLRQLFEGPNANGDYIPHAVLWRAKAMQCEGVGEDWVSILQRQVTAQVTDAEMDAAADLYPLNTPHTKEELYYRRIFEEHYAGMAHVVNPWEGGCRAAGAAWESDAYTREGLANTNVLTHAFQKKSAFSTSAQQRSLSTSATGNNSRRSFSTAAAAPRATLASMQEDEFIQVATAAGYDKFESFLTSGGDDRNIVSSPNGTNKYHMTPRPVAADAVFRGSCTCNAPTERGYNAAKELYEEFAASSNVGETLSNVFEDQRRRIAECLELPEGVEVVLCPSGSDAEYIPIAMARALNPEKSKKIVNIITQLKEIGAGSSIASHGEYFSTMTPLGGTLPAGSKQLDGMDTDAISDICIPARERDGSVLDAPALAAEAARAAENDGAYTIVHGVFGGKTGLRDGVMPASKDAGQSSLGVVDACQGRFSLEELRGWLDQDSVVLFTASKFFQAPPFCGAIFIPKRIANRLREAGVPEPFSMFGSNGLGGFMTEKELPECMEHWKSSFESNGEINNVGLALRWEAGLAGMEALSGTPDAVKVKAVEEWAGRVNDMVDAELALDAWCVERSIVSIRLKHNSEDRWLNMSELREVFRLMSLDLSNTIESATEAEKATLAVPCNLGQPVDVADSHAILRIALGAESTANFLDDPDQTLKEDEAAVKKLAAISKYFDRLMG